MGTRRQQQRREKVGRAGQVPVWGRFPHAGLGMPVPAVYVPRADLPPGWPVLEQFLDTKVHMSTPGGAELPVVHGAAADIRDPAGLTLVELELDDAPGTSELIVASQACEVAQGAWAVPADEAWTREAYAARMLMLVVGPMRVDRPHTNGQLLFTPGTVLGVVPLVAPRQPA